MDISPPLIFGLELPARAMTAVTAADPEVPAFAVGTQSPRTDNQVHIFHYHEEEESLSATVYSHAPEIWNIAATSSRPGVIATCHSKGSAGGATVWNIPEVEDEEGADDQQPTELDENFSLDCSSRPLSFTWHPTSADKMMSLDPTKLALWDVGEAAAVDKGTAAAPDGEIFDCCRWNPHHGAAFVATASKGNVRCWDTRTMEQSSSLLGAHGGAVVRCIDFNPNKQYHLLTGGDDGHVKFWDLRKDDTPLLDFKTHSHWVWSARFNHYHDQLIASSSSDFQVGLSNAGSISSVLYAQLDEDEDEEEDASNAPTPDGLIAMYEEHEDSVYTVEWSLADPWLFASVSFSGRFILNHVPRETKFSILL